MKILIAVLFVVGCSHAPPPLKETAEQPIVQRAAPPPRGDADEEMKVSGTLGTLNDEEVSGPFQRRWDDITACFTSAKSKLWYLGGKVELKFRVAHSGDPKAVYVSASTVGNYDVERCILSICKDLRFSRPHGGSEAEFVYPIEFHGKAAVANWDADRVAPMLKKPKPRHDVSECKQRSPSGLPSSLQMTVYIAPGGKISSAGLAADAPIDDGFANCLVAKAQAWRLEDPLGKIAKATVQMGD